MPETEHMDVTPLQSDQNRKGSCAEQTTLERSIEFGCGSVCNEASEQKPEIVQNEQGEINKARSSGAYEEELQVPSEDVTHFSVTEHLDSLSEDGSKGHSGIKSCEDQTISEHGDELGSRRVSSGSSEQNNQLSSELIPSLPVETRDIEQMVKPSDDKTKDFPIKQLELPPVDVSKISLVETDSCRKQITSEQVCDVGSQSTHSEPSKTESQLALEHVQNETEETSSSLSKCAAVEQLGSSPETLIISSSIGSIGAPLEGATSSEKLALPSEDKTKESLTAQLGVPPVFVINSNLAGTGSCPQQSSEQRHELDCGSVHSEPSEQENQISPETEPFKKETVEISHACGCVDVEQLEPPAEVPTINSLCENQEVPPEDATKTSSPEKLAQASEDVVKDSSFEELETSHKNTVDCFSLSGSPEKKSPRVLKKKYRVKHLVDSDRVLRPRLQEKPKPPESSTDLVSANTETKVEKKKRKQRVSNVTADEFLRIRQRLRYFQNKINYERSLIDAYSGEGWKGLSMEKLRPEKELQRAASEILRQKLRIRDLFQHLESLCAEGRIPKSLFDSEGEIDCEDIFCAKCRSTDVSLDNDILLCDGACERAFHQFCLEPPLRKEDIPPDDEGWFCPGCDCKFDCIDLLNESQGTDLSLTDSWEKVFPEAAPTSGQNQDPNFGLPSDDSEDDDYDPDGLERDEKVREDASSSDESQYTTASDDSEKPANEEQLLGIPSDDSEDDDFDPSARDHDDDDDDKVKHESSGSDFTSDSEDLVALLNDGVPSGKDGDSACSSLETIKAHRGSDGKRSNVGRKRKQFVNEELSSHLEPKHGEEDDVPASGKRRIERLDYKKLHDEEYGNDSTDSSDDEIWTAKETQDKASSDSSDDDNWEDEVTERKRKKTTGEDTPVSSNGTTRSLKDINAELIDPKHTSRKKTGRKMNSEDANGSTSTPRNDPSLSGSSGKKARSSTATRLGEAAIQELHKSFRENQYPDTAMRETLAARLELTPQQISKWFSNTRWSDRHSACTEPCSTACLAKQSRRKTPLTEKSNKSPEPEPEKEPEPEPVTRDTTPERIENNGTPKTSTAAPECSGGAIMEITGNNIKDSRKRKGKLVDAKGSTKKKGKSGNAESRNDSVIEVVHALPADFPKPGSKIQRRTRKSIGLLISRNLETKSGVEVENQPVDQI